MDIRDKVSPEDKGQVVNLILECQVLNKLLKEHQTILENKAKEILARNGLSPQSYDLKCNPSQDLWQAELKEGALILPNREERRALKRN